MIVEKSVYPNVFIRKNKFTDGSFNLILETYLRKKYRGRYYLQQFYRNVFVNSDDAVLSFIEHFHSEVYKSIILGKVDLKIISGIPPHRKIFNLDDNQISEEERLI